MTMTARQFRAIAEALRRQRAIADREPSDRRDAAHAALNGVTVNLASIMATENPRFDVARFFDAADHRPD